MGVRKFGKPVKNSDGTVWQYYVETHFALLPFYTQGTLVWLRRYWSTFAIDQDGKPVPLTGSTYPFDPTTEVNS